MRGKVVFERDSINLIEDHPRRCGEKLALVGDLMQEVGSPPQVRGKGHRIAAGRKRGRITPAGAGKR